MVAWFVRRIRMTADGEEMSNTIISIHKTLDGAKNMVWQITHRHLADGSMRIDIPLTTGGTVRYAIDYCDLYE